MTRGVVLAREVRLASTFLQRLRGLWGERFFLPGKGLLLKPCKAVHSWFVPFPFDVVFLDAELRVVAVVEALPPFRCTGVVWEAEAALELPAGVVRLSGTRAGDQLALKSS